MQPESKKLVKEDGGGGFFPNKKNKKTNKKEEMLQKGGSNIWTVPVPHDQISTHGVKKNRLAILLASIHAFFYTKIKK